MKAKSFLILTEAAAMVPLVRRILVDVREARSRLCAIEHRCRRVEWTACERTELKRRGLYWRDRLSGCLAEAEQLGVAITPGVRCEALFPFEHQWIGARGDGKVRQAYFIYNDALPTIRYWYFSGWPKDRRRIAPHWWNHYRPTARRPLLKKAAA